ncbi:hypothetical protein Plhal304r1_c008g0032291 [Plasmopara halstedii]
MDEHIRVLQFAPQDTWTAVALTYFPTSFTLQKMMVNTLPQNCAWNTREFRIIKTNAALRCEPARCIGTTPEVVIHNFLEVQHATSTFL